MKKSILNLSAVVVFQLLAIQSINSQTKGNNNISDKIANFDSQQIHYLQSGSGTNALVLLHGWPESSYMWKHIIPKLSKDKSLTIIAPDLRGINGSTTPDDKFDKASMAGDINKLVEHLNLDKVIVVGHDIGGMVAYAYARLYPKNIVGLGILDVPLPGLGTWDELIKTEHAWHFLFHNQKPLAENLVIGNQEEYFRFFMHGHSVNKKAIDNNVIEEHARAYTTRASLKAGFEWYRAFSDDALFNITHTAVIDFPVLLVGAQYSMESSLPEMRKSLELVGVNSITTATVAESGHYIVEEKPDETTKLIIDFITKVNN